MLVLSTILNPSFFSKVSEVFCTYVRARALNFWKHVNCLFPEAATMASGLHWNHIPVGTEVEAPWSR